MKPKGRVFISGAYSGTPEEIEYNLLRASRVVEEVLNAGWVPICPNVFWHPFSEFQDYEFWLEAALGLIETCRVLVLIPGWERSSGVAKEIARSKELGIPILTLEALLLLEA
jgi:hypothetical protein